MVDPTQGHELSSSSCFQQGPVHPPGKQTANLWPILMDGVRVMGGWRVLTWAWLTLSTEFLLSGISGTHPPLEIWTRERSLLRFALRALCLSSLCQTLPQVHSVYCRLPEDETIRSWSRCCFTEIYAWKTLRVKRNNPEGVGPRFRSPPSETPKHEPFLQHHSVGTCHRQLMYQSC